MRPGEQVTAAQLLNVLASFGFARISLGGNCIGFRMNIGDGRYVLVTNDWADALPTNEATHVCAGVYSADGDVLREHLNLEVGRVAEFVTQAINVKS